MMTRRELFGSGAFGAAAGLEQSPAIDRRVLEQVDILRSDAVSDFVGVPYDLRP